MNIWLAWTAACTLSAALSLVILHLVQTMPGAGENRPILLLYLPALAVLSSAGQYPLLALGIHRPLGWFAASLLGWAAGGLVVWLASLLTAAGDVPMAIALPLLGACLGLSQSLYLHRHFRHAVWWFLSSLSAFMLVGMMVGRAFPSPWALLLVGLVPGVVTGAVLGVILTNKTPY